MVGDGMDVRADAAVAPPTVPGELESPTRRRSSTWPVVIGIIAVIVGSLGALTNLWGAVAPFFMHAFTGVVASMPNNGQAQDPGAMFEAMSEYRYWMLATSGFAVVLSIWLLITGILLMARHRAAWRLSVTWACLKLVAVVAAVMVTYVVQRAQFEAMNTNPNSPAPAMFGKMTSIMAIGTSCVVLVWGWAFPIFILIWFYLRPIRTETADWGRQGLDAQAAPNS
jgi:hypothetical protein